MLPVYFLIIFMSFGSCFIYHQKDFYKAKFRHCKTSFKNLILIRRRTYLLLKEKTILKLFCLSFFKLKYSYYNPILKMRIFIHPTNAYQLKCISSNISTFIFKTYYIYLFVYHINLFKCNICNFITIIFSTYLLFK